MLRSPADRTARRRLAAIAASAVSVAALTASPTAALAQGCTGQPGTSALEQYCEAVPRGDGGRDRPGSSGNGSGSSGNGVSSNTQRTLSQSGADGAAVAALASGGGSGSGGSGSGGSGASGSGASGAGKSQSGKSSESSKKSGSGSTGGASSSGATASGDAGAVKGIRVEGPEDPSSNPLKAATTAASSGPVAGPTLVWGLVGMTAIGAIAAVVLRRRQPLAPPGTDES